MMPEVQSLS